MRIFPSRRILTAAWRAAQALIALAVLLSGWRLIGHNPYRIDIDVYRMGGQAWLQGRSLYAADAGFHTQIGLDLPFTYPPLAAITFSPLAWISLSAAGIAHTVITAVLLWVALWMVLTRVEFWPTSQITREPAWMRRWWISAALVAVAALYFEPLRANLAFGQINVILMTLVLVDCLPRRTPWPRGMLVGLAIALKLTPAVFLLFFILCRNMRATVTAVCTCVLASAAAAVLAWTDSWQYWTTTVRHTDRIGHAALNTNQNIAGALARLSFDQSIHTWLWVVSCMGVLVLTIWAVRRVVGAGEPVLGLMCVALFGLIVSPVSWSHHWVWALPTTVVLATLAYQRRSSALAALSAVGLVLMVWSPLYLLPEHHEEMASWWRQLVGMSYVWWALAVIITAGRHRWRNVTAGRFPAVPESATDYPAAVSGIRADT